MSWALDAEVYDLSARLSGSRPPSLRAGRESGVAAPQSLGEPIVSERARGSSGACVRHRRVGESARRSSLSGVAHHGAMSQTSGIGPQARQQAACDAGHFMPMLT